MLPVIRILLIGCSFAAAWATTSTAQIAIPYGWQSSDRSAAHSTYDHSVTMDIPHRHAGERGRIHFDMNERH